MSADDKIKSFLSDLGRATLRGVRRCPNCGTYNGTRGVICKKCSCLIKEKRKLNSEACKLITGNSTQIYSVKVHDKGPDYRGFVQLPLFQSKTLSQDSDSFVLSETALCFVDSCQRLFDTSILKCHEHETDQSFVNSMCQHIEAAVKCSNEVTPLEIKPTAINLLNACEEIKQEFCQLYSQSPVPIVQRVSKNVMAVKCQVTPKHPLGYLHFSFQSSKLKDHLENHFICPCGAESIGHNTNIENSLNSKKCVHYYACICALASDSKLIEEFSAFLNAEQLFKVPIHTDNNSAVDSLTISDNQLVSILDNDFIDPSDVCDIEIEVLNENPLLNVPNLSISEVIDSSIQVQNLEINENGEVTIIRGLSDDTLPFADLTDNLLVDSIELNPSLELIPLKKPKRDNTPKISKPKASKRQNVRSITKDESKKARKVPIQKQDIIMEEKHIELSFIQWLASVTERINQTMHYQFNGKPDPLIFQVPQVFFDCLRERLSFGLTKKRLPNFTSVFIRKEGVPTGTFTKYTWHITNILHVKQIFETPLISLEVTKSFVQNRDGTFDLYVPKGDEIEDIRNDGLIPIKPLELKTYLKVGNTSRNQVVPTPFIIEWIPDILPISRVGELRIRFEFGHQKGNGTRMIKISKNK